MHVSVIEGWGCDFEGGLSSLSLSLSLRAAACSVARTFSRENRTLYVGRLNTTRPLQKLLSEQFAEFGEIESVKVLKDKACAFVKFRLRAAAEFAKEAMACQVCVCVCVCVCDARRLKLPRRSWRVRFVFCLGNLVCHLVCLGQVLPFGVCTGVCACVCVPLNPTPRRHCTQGASACINVFSVECVLYRTCVL